MMSAPEIVGIADDFTGAMEFGAKFAGHGFRSFILTKGQKWQGFHKDVVVYDGQTRHLQPREAYASISRLVREIAPRPDTLLFKKTDSTLRGNLPEELEALASFTKSSILLVPAYPELGRIVRNGILQVDGVPVSKSAYSRDPLNPVRCDSVLEIFSGRIQVPVQLVTPAELAAPSSPAILVCDCGSQHDLGLIGKFVLSHPTEVIPAGSAGFAGVLACLLGAPARALTSMADFGSCLIINGSMHPASSSQIEHARKNGIPVVSASELQRMSTPPSWVIVHTDNELHGFCGLDRASRAGALIAKLAEQHRTHGLMIFGGDTAYGFIEAIGHPPVRALGEIVAGVPVSIIQREQSLILLTKAGGFGGSDVIMRIRERVND